jgi:hypothetical protein
LSSGYEGTELRNLLKVENCPHRIDNISQGTWLTRVLDDWLLGDLIEYFSAKTTDGGLLTVFIAVVATTAKVVFSFCGRQLGAIVGTDIYDVKEKALEWVKSLFENLLEQLSKLTWLDFTAKMRGCEVTNVDKLDDTVTVQLNLWEAYEERVSPRGAHPLPLTRPSGCLRYFTLIKLPFAELFTGQPDANVLTTAVKESALQTVDRHGIIFLPDKVGDVDVRSRVMTMLMNAISERFRHGFVMFEVDKHSVEMKEYVFCLTNETGPRVGGQDKIRLFMTDGTILDELADKVNFKKLCEAMEHNWDCKNKADQNEFISDTIQWLEKATSVVPRNPLRRLSTLGGEEKQESWGPFQLKQADDEFCQMIQYNKNEFGYAVAAQSKQLAGWPCEVEWPPTGKCSIQHPVNIPAHALTRLCIPKRAASFVFLYPARGMETLPQATRLNFSKHVKHSHERSLMAFGGFLYFDRHGRVLAANACHPMDPTSCDMTDPTTTTIMYEKVEQNLDGCDVIADQVEHHFRQMPQCFHRIPRSVIGMEEYYCWIAPQTWVGADDVEAGQRKIRFGAFAFHCPSDRSRSRLFEIKRNWGNVELHDHTRNQLGGLKPSFQHGNNWKRWQTLIEMAKMKQDQLYHRNNLWSVQVYVPKAAPLQNAHPLDLPMQG